MRLSNGEEGKEKCQQFRHKCAGQRCRKSDVCPFGNLKICDICIVSRLVDHIENGMKTQHDLFGKQGRHAQKHQNKTQCQLSAVLRQKLEQGSQQETADCQRQKDSFSNVCPVEVADDQHRAKIPQCCQEQLQQLRRVPFGRVVQIISYRFFLDFQRTGDVCLFHAAPPSESVSVR